MIAEVNWDNLEAKFAANKQESFEWLCYLLSGKGTFSLRVPMVDEDSGDPSVGVELHDLELEPAHAAP